MMKKVFFGMAFIAAMMVSSSVYAQDVAVKKAAPQTETTKKAAPQSETPKKAVACCSATTAACCSANTPACCSQKQSETAAKKSCCEVDKIITEKKTEAKKKK